MKLYIGNILYSATADEVRNMFERFGAVDEAIIIHDRNTGVSKGFGFVTMPDDDEAKAAIEQLHGSNFQGRNLTVNKARPKKDA